MNDYSKKILKVPTVTFVREQDQGKQPVLDVRNLGIDFGGLTAVDSFNITIGPTEISGLIGPNGAGKTTIFNLLTGVYQPTRGSVLVNGIDIKGMPVYKVNKLGIARTFQNIRLFTDMTVLDNVKVGLHNSMKCSFFSSVLHLPGYFKAEKRANEKAMELLDFMGLAEHANEKAGSLPYGVQRRLGAGGPGDEGAFAVDVLAAMEAVVGVLAQHLFIGAAVLAAHAHFAVSHLDAGL